MYVYMHMHIVTPEQLLLLVLSMIKQISRTCNFERQVQQELVEPITGGACTSLHDSPLVNIQIAIENGCRQRLM